MPDANERIVLEVDDRSALAAQRRSAEGMDRVERSATKAAGGVATAVDQAGERVVRLVDRSQTSIDRIVQRAEQKARSAGKTQIERLELQRTMDLGRVSGDPRAIDRITNAYGKLIDEQKKVDAGAMGLGGTLKRAFENPRGALDSVIGGLTGLPGILAAAATAVAGLGLGIFRIVQSMGDWQDELNNVSNALGLARRDVQLFDAVAIASGLSTDLWQGMMKGLSRTLEDTTEEARQGRAEIARMGVSIFDAAGKTRGTRELFLDLGDAIGKIQSPTERMAKALDILGKGGAQGAKIFNGRLRETFGILERSGHGIDDELLKPLDRMDERLDRAAAKWEDWSRRAKLAVVELADTIITRLSKNAIEERLVPKLERNLLIPEAARAGIAQVELEISRAPKVPSLGTDPRTTTAALNAQLQRSRDLGASILRSFNLERERSVTGLQRRLAALQEDQKKAEIKLEGTGLGESAARTAVAEVKRLDSEIASVQARIKAIQEAPQIAEQRLREQQRITADVEKRRLEFIRTSQKEALDAAAEEAALMLAQEQRLRQAQVAFSTETAAIQDRVRQAAFDQEAVLIERSRDQQLRSVESVGARTVEEKIALEQRKLDIEIKYLKSSEALQMAKIQRETAESIFEARRLAQTKEEFDQRLAAINEEAAMRQKIANAGTADAILAAQENTANRASELVLDNNRRMFERFKQSADGLLDHLLTSSKSFAGRLADAFKLPVLAAIKELASNSVASLLMRVLGGGGGGGGGFGLGRLGAGGLLGSFAFPAFGGIAQPGAPGGTPGFAGPVGGIGGLGGALGGLRGFGGLNLGGVGPLALGGAALGLTGAFRLGQRGGVGGAFAPALGAASGLFGFGALVSIFPSLLAAGPLGWIAAGGIGAFAGLLGLLGKSAEEKAREKIERAYGVSIREKKILQSILAIAKQTYGGNLDAAIASQPVRDIVELYKLTMTGSGLGFSSAPRPFSAYQSGGAIYQTPGTPALTRPYSAAPAGGITVVMPMQFIGAEEVFSNKVVTAIGKNGRAVQTAALSAQKSNVGRTQAARLQLAPNMITSA